MHFSHPLPFFEHLISGTRKLVDFCFALDRPIRLLFTSSVATAQSWDPAKGYAPEEVVQDNDVLPANGYAASKYVVEQVGDKDLSTPETQLKRVFVDVREGKVTGLGRDLSTRRTAVRLSEDGGLERDGLGTDNDQVQPHSWRVPRYTRCKY